MLLNTKLTIVYFVRNKKPLFLHNSNQIFFKFVISEQNYTISLLLYRIRHPVYPVSISMLVNPFSHSLESSYAIFHHCLIIFHPVDYFIIRRFKF